MAGSGISWGWVTPSTWLLLQVTWIEYFNLKPLELGETLDLTPVTSQLYITLRLGETLDLTHVTSKLYRIFYALRLVDTLNLTHVTNKSYRIFWLVYPEGGWDPGLDSCYMSFMYNIWLENPGFGWDPGLDSRYKWIIQNVLTGVPWGWVTPWTWLMLQVNYLDCFD